ncbi:aspartyl-phosphate phosphatase Spo0E family protein [Wansuia hejianensis]|uniref:Aspartyl-phosphate phosphatase Spo0E family protein n=1 Tax=Wansuia hejianensis TaxID=2763667 RepID=A0A926ILP3_9FIRM|nr:aspartyl-phosphate phosphatase Spo0E family protein [Wansuia hejianensis]MBC8590354.1 aspartyl-phosphate phosphatase Spo0E family protein [Wansuia hejianensis]
MVERINRLKKQLNKLLEIEDPTSKQVLKLSQELDKFIVAYQKQEINKSGLNEDDMGICVDID